MPSSVSEAIAPSAWVGAADDVSVDVLAGAATGRDICRDVCVGEATNPSVFLLRLLPPSASVREAVSKTPVADDADVADPSGSRELNFMTRNVSSEPITAPTRNLFTGA